VETVSQADGLPTTEQLSQFLLGTLSPEDQLRVEELVATNPVVLQTLSGLNPVSDTLLTAVQASQAVAVPLQPELRGLIDAAKRLASLPLEGDQTAALPGDGRSADTDELTAWKGRISPPEQADELGRLGGYRLLRVLGRGGMGVVFEAEDPRLGRRVALKVVQPSIADDQATHDRFLREARATAAVEHENIVTIHQVGEDRGVPFLAMPLLQGESLEDRLRREGRLPVADVIRIGREIALGLSAAHEQGLIHRDIKPGNIWLDARSGRVKILDFGLARGTEQAADHITQTGAIVGTPAYMAPEQAEGLTLDSRCDLFSLGCVLYRLATGELPFPGNSAIQILSCLATRTPPRVATVVPGFPPALSDLIAQLMAKSPAERPATADEVWRLLDRALETPVAALQPVPQSAAARGGWITIVAILTAMAGGGWWLFGVTILLIATNQGELTIQVDDPNIEVIVRQNDAEVYHKSTQRRFRVRPVNGEVEFLDPETGAVALTRKFELKRAGQRTTVSITAQQMMAARTPSAQVETALPSTDLSPLANPPSSSITPSPAVAPFNAQAAQDYQSQWATSLGTPVALTDSIGIQMVLIPPGEFLMGSSDEQIDEVMKLAEQLGADQTAKKRIPKAERPQHRVVLTRPFMMGVTEVTIGQFKQFAAATGFQSDAEKAAIAAGPTPLTVVQTYLNPGYAVTDSFPVATVTWNDAVAFCEWLSRQEGVKYRLPTEAEWEFSCRAGSTTHYFFGDNYEQLDQYAWWARNNNRIAHPVGTKLPNPFGLYDMYGNLSEWCQDLWQENWYASGSTIEPLGPTEGVDRVTRGGGGANANAIRCRSAFRAFDTPLYRPNHNGFRVVRELPPVLRTQPEPSQVASKSVSPAETDSSPPAASGGLRFDAKAGRVEVPLYLPANAAMTVEIDCTFGETHPFQEQRYLFAHTGNLEIKALANTLILHSGSYPDQRAKISADDVIVPGRRVLLAVTISNSKMQLFVNGQRGNWHQPAKPGYADGRRADMNIGRPGGTQLAFDGIIHRLRISEGERYHEDYTPEPEWVPGKDALALYDFRKDDPQLKAIDLTGRGNHGKISSAKWVPHSEPPPAATVTASVGGLDFNPFDGRIEVPLQLPVNTPLTVECDVTHGEIHPIAEQYYLFQHNKNLYYGIQGDRVVLNTGPWPDVRAHFYKVNVVEPGRRRQIAATVTDERLQLFVDGRRVEWQNTSRLETDATPVPVWLGRPDGAPGNRAFDGLLHRVRISTGEKYDKSYTPEAEWQPDATTLVLYDFRTVDPALGVTTAATVTTPLKIPPYPTSPDDLPAEFMPLFNGQGLTGWKAAVGDPKTRAAMTPDELAQAQAKADQQLPSHWRVANGVLACDGHGHNLQTVKDYTDFELYLEWKIGAGGDSGVYLRGSPQVQIIDSAASKYEKDLGSGGLFNNRKHTKTPLVYADKPVGEWNAMFIRMVGEKVTVSLNGKLVVDNVVYENFVEPDQPIYPTGPIELQRYGQPVEFRNIRIRELTSVKPPPGTTGMVAHDLSGKGNHGKIVSSQWVKGTEPSTAVKPAPMENTKAAVTAATPRWALQFDGDDYVKVRDVNWGRFENYTVEAFVTPERTSENVGFVVLQQRNVTLALNRRETTGGWFLSYRHAEKESPEYVYGHAPAEMNRRVHLAGVANGKQFRLYVDGKLAGTTTAQRERAGIPGDNYDFGNNFFGTIDGIRLSKAARYEAPFTPPPRLERDDETLAVYQFGEGTGEMLMDSSGNGHHGNIVGAKWVSLTALPANAAAIPSSTPPTWTLRSMSEWAIQHGGQVLLGDGRTIARLQDLPAEVTRVDQISFTHVESFGDAEAAIVGSWPKLKGIAVGDTTITDAGLRKLAALPLGNILSVPTNAITGAGFEAFAEKSLGTVVVAYCRLSPAGWKFLAGVGGTNQWLCQSTNLTDDALAEIVARHPEITYLDAQRTELTDACAEHLARLKNLRELFLQETGIGDSGLEKFAPLQSLTSLTLQQTKVTAAGVAKLQQALPNCQIRWK
jgi:eukaryotic-like serine/threonine-protein kinase